LLDVRKIASFTDYFVLCTATSDRMLKALAEATAEGARKQNARKGRIEGKPEDGWLVVDYGDIVVHLFASDLRKYYRLEELWSDGKILLRLQ
jgi:ribosome-associated protein